MSLRKLSMGGNNLIIPAQVTSQPGTGMSLTFFYGVWTGEGLVLAVERLHCKKELAVFPSPAGMSLIKLFLGGNNLVFSRPERVWSVTSRLGTGKWLTLFYSVYV
jgi:hypothetical protein